MQIAAHLAISWFSAEAAGLERARDRRIVALAGVAPDVDAVVYPVAWVWFGFDLDRAYAEAWEPVHHHYTHGIGFALATGALAWRLAGPGPGARPAAVAALAFLVSLAHVFCDVVGAGSGWPVYPLWPLSDAPWSVPWSWNVSAWPNSAMTVAGLVATLAHARAAGRSPVEAISPRADAWMAAVTRGEGGMSPRAARRLRFAVWGILALVTAALVTPLVVGL